MRVIAGIAKGVPLVTRKSIKTRPTLDRIKENLFNIIQNRIDGAIVADLFSGSGSLCIESLSRGAKRAYFIEKNKESIKCIIANLNKTKLTENAIVYNADFIRGAELIRQDNIKLDIVFIDPPHKKGLVQKALKSIAYLQLLSDDGIIVVEHHSDESFDERLESFVLVDKRQYSNTTISFYCKEKEE